MLSRRRWLAHAIALPAGLALLPAQAAQAIKAEGYTFAGSITLGGVPLELNGVGYRAVAWFKGYAAGLYLARKASTPAQVLATPGPKRLQMRMLVDVDTEEFVKAFEKGVARNTPDTDLPGLQPRMARFDAEVRALDKVHKLDVIDLDFLPASGLQMSVNGKPRGEPIPGEDLYAAFLRVFLGDKPVDQKLRAGLLGAPLN